jgi:hypothetical protein
MRSAGEIRNSVPDAERRRHEIAGSADRLEALYDAGLSRTFTTDEPAVK